ncbi:50S ribosomal protein L10 [Coxiella burnetii]|uniref:Large ribosomal subunit protein uL10 n=6 Tax=Coxiella burnetii TaxID=777 RepID=RL10_COXBU|nr:50S ribosomal protein L10 [Coxiella burnetii]NP_819272.1 50S ribosomal protein L10 [Coxiella burnetii RSA 493]A9KD41.1 RecName: Full=Large ribosomal subunit protein uL10; AltName: Full=50S ribosomal protein L10 [Coxiella burnetii Dugway 5J108-111]A9NAL2.1 RecName: Full=Large ribosomal subunit protein uL10; AltName: Full=50S ribosomal protein L10 [Coxiella burnetii RSA 331]B6J273.1 RecName: Full=Large ribosomal subunit protein uL10; AltName: Full=50S ribosomal protein L10 [Coxiella burnetii C
MALNLEQKKAMVAEITDIANQAVSAVAADYRGLTVSEMSDLRKSAREARVHMRVYRNTLARRAFKETTYACLEEVLTGPIVLFFSQEEPGAAARLIEKFIKEHERLEVKGLALGGELLPAEKLKAVARLPSREEALSQLAAVLLAPVTKLVRTLNEPIAQVARVMAAVRDQKAA